MSALQQRLRRLVVVSATVILSSVTGGCLMDVPEDDVLGEAEVALVDGDEDLDAPASNLEDGSVDETGEDFGTSERGFNPEPQPWEEDGLGGDRGGPEPQPWHEDGDADGPEPQPWHNNLVGEDADPDPKLPGEDVYDDNEPDPSPWVAALARTPQGLDF